MKRRIAPPGGVVLATLALLALALSSSALGRELAVGVHHLYSAQSTSRVEAAAPWPADTETAQRALARSVRLEPLEARLLELLNAARLQRGLRPLELDRRLVDLARRRSSDMATRRYFGHVTPEGFMVFDMMDRERIPYRLAGENLARNSSSPASSPEVAHRGFMHSPKHAENDYDPSFNRVGIGVATSPTQVIYYTELFAILDD